MCSANILIKEKRAKMECLNHERKIHMSVNGNIEMTVRREIWTSNDYIEEVDTVSFDATEILGSMSNDELPDPNDIQDCGDFIFETAMATGIADKYDGPYTVLYSPEYDDYYTARMDGIIAPDIEQCRRNIKEKELQHDEKQLNRYKEIIASLEMKINDEKHELRDMQL